MRNPLKKHRLLALAAVIAGASVLTATPAIGHCDTEDGPVVRDAKKALASGEVTPVLKWVREGDEPEIRRAFAKAVTVRDGGPSARELADTWFFETLVRVHRAGEGAPYTGLKPAGTPLEPAVRMSDGAMKSGSLEPLVRELSSRLHEGLGERFRRTSRLRSAAEDNVDAGRAYVAAYVEFVHYTERIHEAIVADAHGDGARGAGHEH